MELLATIAHNQDLYQIAFDRGPVVFRLLSIASYNGFRNFLLSHPRSKALVEEEIWQQCIAVNPYDEDEMAYLPAGIVTTIVQVILFLSAPQSFEDIKEQQLQTRNLVQSQIHLQLQAAICKAFPAYTPEALDKLTFTELLIRLAQAEYIIGKNLDLEPPETQKKSKKPNIPVDFVADNQQLEQYGSFQDPHSSFGLRR